jgi:hypothetical protein
MANTESNPPPPSPALPSETVRGFVSLLIIIHVFAVVVALASYTSASRLQIKLSKEMLAPYLRNFNFDMTHVYPAVTRLHLTHADVADIDFALSGELKNAAGQPESWQLPESGLWPRIRYQRQLQLANAAGGLAQREDEEAEILPRALATSKLQAAGAKSGTLKVTAHYLPNIEDLTSPETARRDPFNATYYQAVFDAKTLAGPMGLDLLKTSAKGEVAPVSGGKATGPAPARPSTKE